MKISKKKNTGIFFYFSTDFNQKIAKLFFDGGGAGGGTKRRLRGLSQWDFEWNCFVVKFVFYRVCEKSADLPKVQYSVPMYSIVYQMLLREKCLLSPRCPMYTVVYTSYLSLWKRYRNFLKIKNYFLSNIYDIPKFEQFLRAFFFWARKG